MVRTKLLVNEEALYTTLLKEAHRSITSIFDDVRIPLHLQISWAEQLLEDLKAKNINKFSENLEKLLESVNNEKLN